MNVGITLGWLAAVISALVYLAMATTIAAFGDRVAALRFSRKEETGRPSETGTLYISSNALILGRGLQAAALLAGALAVYAGLNDFFGGPADEAAALAASGVATIAVAAVLQLAAWGLASGAPRFARRYMAPVAGMLHAASGFNWLTWIGRISRLGGAAQPSTPATPEAEMSQALKENLSLIEESKIPLQQEELQMIRGILRMDTVKVREIMRPRVDMVVASADSTPDELIEKMQAGGHSKVPVYEGTVDNITGVIYARDLLPALKEPGDTRTLVRRLARPPVFVPESQNLGRLLQVFQVKRTSMAIAVDEYGGVSGLVTMTNLMEDIVGKLEDGSSQQTAELRRTGPSEVIVDARLSIDDLNQALGSSIQPQGFDTVGGLVYRELGRVPTSGDTVQVDGLTLTVQSIAGRRIRQVKVTRRTPEPEIQDQPEG